jgi:3-dehydroquinate synthase
MTAPGTTKRLTDLLNKLGLPTDDPTPLVEYVGGVAMDKKRSGSTIDLVLLRNIGNAYTHRLPVKELRDFLGCAQA